MIIKSKHWRTRFASLVILILAMAMSGCNSQPEVSSPEALTLIKKFYTAASSKNEKRLADSEAEYHQLVEEKKLSEAEKVAFKEIIDLAHDGDWESAQTRALSFAQAQVR